MLLIAVKLVFALPKIFFENSSVREAVQFSLEKTKKRTFFYSWQLFWIVTKTFLFFFGMALPLFLLQHVADGHSNQVATIAGVMNYVLLKNAHYLMLSYFLIKFVSFLTEQGLADCPRRKFDRVLRWLVISIASVFLQ